MSAPLPQSVVHLVRHIDELGRQVRAAQAELKDELAALARIRRVPFVRPETVKREIALAEADFHG